MCCCRKATPPTECVRRFVPKPLSGERARAETTQTQKKVYPAPRESLQRQAPSSHHHHRSHIRSHPLRTPDAPLSYIKSHPRKSRQSAMAGNFFRGTTSEQDPRWGNSEKKLLDKLTKAGTFPAEYEIKVMISAFPLRNYILSFERTLLPPLARCILLGCNCPSSRNGSRSG